MKYERFITGSLALFSVKIKTGSKTINIIKNGYTSVDCIEFVKSKKSMFFRPYSNARIDIVRIIIPGQSIGATFSSFRLGSLNMPAMMMNIQIGMLT